MRSSSPPRAPTRAESSSTPKPPSSRRGDRPHSSKSLGPHLQRSISEDPTSSPLFSPRRMSRAKSSFGEHSVSSPPEQEPVRRRSARVPQSAPGRRKSNIGIESLSDHFRGASNKLPSIDIHSSSRSTYTSISKNTAGASKRSSRPRSSQDDSIVLVRRRARDRSINSDLKPQVPMRSKRVSSVSKSDASVTSGESSQKTIEDESARSQRSAGSSRARGRSDASEDAENEEQISPSKSKTSVTDRNRSKSAKGRRVRRSSRSDISASVSNIDVVSSSASVSFDGDGSVVSAVSNNSRRRRVKSSPVSPPLTTQLESLMSEDKPRSRRSYKDSSSVTSEPLPREPIPREPRRVVQLDNSSECAQIAELEGFFKAQGVTPSRRIASSRSVSSMPAPAPGPKPKKASIRSSMVERPRRSIRKHNRIRMVKSDDEGIIDVMEKKASIRNLRACLTDEEEDFEDSPGEESLNDTDLMTRGRGNRSGKDTRRSARHYSTGQDAVFSDEENGVNAHQVDPSSAHDRMGMSMPSTSDEVMELNALVLQRQEANTGLSKTMNVPEKDPGNGEDTEEDIFTFYSWSTSRQPRSKILKERKKLRDSVREGPLLASYEALMRIE